MNKKSIYLALCIFIVLIASAVNSQVEFKYSSPNLNNDFIINITNYDEINSIKLFYKRGYEREWQNISADSNIIIVPSSFFRFYGIYNFYFIYNSSRSPLIDGSYYSIGFVDTEELLYNWSRIMAINDQDGNTGTMYCRPNNDDFSCGFENMQGAEILRFSELFRLTGNQTAYLYVKNLLNSSVYGLSVPAYNPSSGCDHSYSDFDCESGFALGIGQISGAKRQSLMIYSLWNSYSIIRESYIYNLAINYTNGINSECNVWASDFNCQSSEDQGLMAAAFLKAYEVSGNQSYRSIAENLLSSYSESPEMGFSYFYAYQLLGEESYLDNAEIIADIYRSYCIQTSCSPEKQAWIIMMFSKAYEATGHLFYEPLDRNVYIQSSHSCNLADGDYNCSNAYEQGILNYAILYASSLLKDSIGVYNVHIPQKIDIDEDVIIRFERAGYLEDLRLYYKHSQIPVLKNISLANNQTSVLIDSSELLYGVYEVYFNSTTWHGDALYSFVVPVPFEHIITRVEELKDKDPFHFCDPFGSNPQYNDFSCMHEGSQGWMMQGNIFLDLYYGNDYSIYRYNAHNLAFSEIDSLDNPFNPNDPERSTCEHVYDDFICNDINYNYPNDPERQKSVYRQGEMLNGLLETYRASYNDSLREIILNYLNNQNEQCNVWDMDFNCGGAQGSLASAYWKAYDILGINQYKEIAINLSENLLSIVADDYTEESAIALWQGYRLTGNLDYFGKAENITQNYSSTCVFEQCDTKTFAKQIILFWDAAVISRDVSFIPDAYKKTIARPFRETSDCDPNSPSGSLYRCKYADTQGMMVSAYTKAVQSYFSIDNKSFSINVSDIEIMNYSDDYIFECNITNLNSIPALNIHAYLITDDSINNVESQGTPNSQNNVIHFSTIGGNSRETISWNLTSINGGYQSISCLVESFSGSDDYIADNIPHRGIFDFHSDEYRDLNKGSYNAYYVWGNDYDFMLFNYSIEINYNSSIITILNITSTDIDTEIDINLSPDLIRINQEFFDKHKNITLNITYNPNHKGLSQIDFTRYFEFNQENRTNTSFHRIYEEPFLITADYPLQSNIMQDFFIVFDILNNESFTFNNLSLFFNYTGQMTILNTTGDGIIIDNQSLLIPSLNPLDNSIFSIHGFAESNISFNLEISSLNHNLERKESTYNISLQPQAFIIQDTSFPSNLDYGFEPFDYILNLTSNTSHTLNNVNIVLSSDGCIRFDSIDVSVPENISALISVDEAFIYGNNITAILNADDNNHYSLTGSDSHNLNITFDFGNLNITYADNITIELAHNDINSDIYYKLFLMNNSNNSLNEEVCRIEGTTPKSSSFCNINLTSLANSSITDKTINLVIEVYSNSGNINSNIDYTGLLIEGVYKNDHHAVYTNLDNSNSSTVSVSIPEFESMSSRIMNFRIIHYCLSPAEKEENVRIEITSSEDTFDSKVHSVRIAQMPSDSQSSSSPPPAGSSGGGGGGGAPKDPLEYRYNYLNYDLFYQLRLYPDLYEFSSFIDDYPIYNLSSIYGLTQSMKGCINITREYIDDNTTRIKIDSGCIIDNLSYCYFFDPYITSIDYSSISIDMNKKAHKEDIFRININSGLLFNLSTNTSEFTVIIDYLIPSLGNKITKFTSPLFFCDYIQPVIEIEDIPLIENETILEDIPTIPELTVNKTDDRSGKVIENSTISASAIIKSIKNSYNEYKRSGSYFILFIIATGLLILIINKKTYTVITTPLERSYIHLVRRIRKNTLLSDVIDDSFVIYHKSLKKARIMKSRLKNQKVKDSSIMDVEKQIIISMNLIYKFLKRTELYLLKGDDLSAKPIIEKARQKINGLQKYIDRFPSNLVSTRFFSLRTYENFLSLAIENVKIEQQLNNVSEKIINEKKKVPSLHKYKNLDIKSIMGILSQEDQKSIMNIQDLEREHSKLKENHKDIIKQLQGYNRLYIEFKKQRNTEIIDIEQDNHEIDKFLREYNNFISNGINNEGNNIPGIDSKVLLNLESELYYILHEIKYFLKNEQIEEAKKSFKKATIIRSLMDHSFNLRKKRMHHDYLLDLYDDLKKSVEKA